MNDRLRRYVTSMGLGIVLAFAASLTAIYERADLWLGDAFMRTLTPVDRYEGVAVVDVDEDSMTALESQLGAWPYPRQIYAVVGEYLARAGAKAVIYDILFSEAREGDAEFAASLQGRPAALAAAALPQLIERSRGYGDRLQALAWPAAPEAPRRRWPDITLPVAELAPGGGSAGVGVVTLQPDGADGVVRRIPLLHGVQDMVLPALPLAALHADGPKPRVEYAAGRIRVGDRSWPVNASSEVVLRFPARAEGLHIVPFYEVVLAALDRPNYAHVAARFKGKTVAVGSSALRLGDYVQTPMGRTQGVVVTAMAVEMLREGRVLAPSSPGWNALLLLIAMIVPAPGFHARLGKLSVLLWFAAPLSAALVLGTASLLFLYGQQASILFAIMVSVLALLADLLGRFAALQRDRQRLAAEKLAAERANEMKSQFMSHMTHELRTPLTAILGFNQRLAREGLEGKERERYVEVVEKSGRHLLTLINNLLDGAKLEAGQMRIAPAPVALAELVQDVIQTLSPLAEPKALSLASRIGPQVPEVLELDALRVKQVLLNLGGNALKFTERGGVTLGLDWREGRLSIAVEDTGPGMDAAQLERIFVPYQQAHERVAQKHGGTGLGLAISRDLCTLMGGTLTAASTPGAGSTFTAVLDAPRAQAAAVAAMQAAAGAADARRAAQQLRLSGRVLVADDSEDLRDLVGFYVGELGLEMIQAVDGAQAMEIALRERPDAVLTDMEMPRMNGAELAQALRAAGYDRPVVLLTAHPEGAETERALRMGCTTYLAKPVDRNALEQTLRSLLA